MDKIKKLKLLEKYKNIFGSTKDTINAIQKFIEDESIEYSVNEMEGNGISGNGIGGNGGNGCNYEEPSEVINRILNSIANEETNVEIQKIIDNM